MRRSTVAMVMLAAALALAGCGTDPVGRTASGAAVGAGSGAAIGAVFGGIGVVPGALIGAAVGGTAGAVTSPRAVNLGQPRWR
jgi:hypothetical protein